MAYNFSEAEQKILRFWQENKIFEKLREKNKGKKPWSFLDGPITANNPMGVHHAWGRSYKDLFQRFKAMQGFDERYQNGFDCQGLWVEVEVEKELGFKSKKDIETYGIDKFVEKCKERVIKYSAIQTQQSIRLGQWMDWDNSYYTMSDENNYSIWHFLKKCWQDGYLYKGRDTVPWCPRCGTAISQHEILTEEYKEITHKAVYFKLPIIGRENEYLLVWTTTPWTLPANIAVAVDENMEYSLAQEKSGMGDKFWVAKELVEKIFEEEYKILKTVKGKELVGLKYSWVFDVLPRVKEVAEINKGKFHIVVATDPLILPITTTEGTGLVHVATGAGSEDFQLGKKIGLPVIEIIDENAVYLDGLGEFSGDNAKDRPEIILDYLRDKGFIFKIEKYLHRYPTCWRCKTELVWRIVDEWYISMDKIRKPLMEITKKINWIPSFGKERELDWLKNMHDWLISKKRYWGLTLPIFECQKCGNFEVIGSKEELKERAVEGWEDFEGHTPHRPWVDKVKIKCKKCGEVVSRIKDVGNPWLDAGIVPFSTMKYSSDKDYWKKWFPAELVCESFPGQFKNWFYSLLVMSAVLEDKNPMKTIFGYASVRDEKGEEMHKSKGNAIWFDDAVEKIGADPMRWLYARQNPAENLGFGYNVIEEIKRKLMTLYNSYVFFNTYIKREELSDELLKVKPENILDKWILQKTDKLVSSVESNLENYNVVKAISAIEDFFINDLSLWYIRRSRKRFHEDSSERNEAVPVFYNVLLNLTKIIAPIMPFFAEQMYQNLKTDNMPESVHLCEWPDVREKKYDANIEEKMDEVRSIVNIALAERTAKGLKVRQPLNELKIKNEKLKIKGDNELLDLIKDEVNVKEVAFNKGIANEVELDINITEELMEEGIVRDIIRLVQAHRKEQNLVPQDTISVRLSVPKKEKLIIEKNKQSLLKEFRAKEIFVEEEQENIGEKYSIKIQLLK